MILSTGIMITHSQADHLLAEWLGTKVRCTDVRRLTGGMINSVVRLEFDVPPHCVVVKLSSNPSANFAAEKTRLDTLRELSCMRVPQVYAIGTPDETVPCHRLLLECLAGRPLTDVRLDRTGRRQIDEHLADILIELHSHHRDTFGDVEGRNPQANWVDIFLPRFLDMREEMPDRVPPAVLANIDQALVSAPAVFMDQGPPTLIHGDLWAGNILVAESAGRWQVSGIVDPGTQYADLECELAFMQCFRTVGATFLDRYTAVNPLRPGYELRRLYYWLHTMMIHVWLFGDSHYCDRTEAIAAEICAEKV